MNSDCNEIRGRYIAVEGQEQEVGFVVLSESRFLWTSGRVCVLRIYVVLVGFRYTGPTSVSTGRDVSGTRG